MDTNFHEKRINEAVLLFRHPAIQPSRHPASLLFFPPTRHAVLNTQKKPWVPSFVIVTPVTMVKAKKGLFTHNSHFFIDLWRRWLHFLREFRVLTNSGELDERVKFLVNALGLCAQPFDCWLVLRGIKTLVVRMREHERNALLVAGFLAQHPGVKRVFYPGLETHPQHELAKKQQRSFGGMVSFELEGGIEDVNRVLGGTRLFALAESLGGVESLIEHPATMSHASMESEQRASAGITDTVIRLSVGIEDGEDLIADLRQALC